MVGFVFVDGFAGLDGFVGFVDEPVPVDGGIVLGEVGELDVLPVVPGSVPAGGTLLGELVSPLFAGVLMPFDVVPTPLLVVDEVPSVPVVPDEEVPSVPVVPVGEPSVPPPAVPIGVVVLGTPPDVVGRPAVVELPVVPVVPSEPGIPVVPLVAPAALPVPAPAAPPPAA